MRYLIFLMICLAGCTSPQDMRFTVDAATRDQLSQLLTSGEKNTSVVVAKLDEQTAVLQAIKDKLETAGGAETPGSPPPPPSPSQSAPPAAPEKPILYYSVTSNCAPCNRLKQDIADGLFEDFDMRLLEDDTWTMGYPVIRWRDGEKWRFLVDPRTKRHLGYSRSMIPEFKRILLP